MARTGRALAAMTGGCLAMQLGCQQSGGKFEQLAVAARPKPADRVAPKRPDGEPSLFLFRFYDAAVRGLTHPAMSRHSSPPGEYPVKTDSVEKIGRKAQAGRSERDAAVVISPLTF